MNSNNISDLRLPPIESVYSQGPIDTFPDVGPERVDSKYTIYDNHIKQIIHNKETVIIEDLCQRERRKNMTGLDYYGSFIALMIIVLIFVFMILIIVANFYQSEVVETNISSIFPSEGIFNIILIFSFVLLFGAGYRGYLESYQRQQGFIFATVFVIVLSLILIWSFVMFQIKNPKIGFIVVGILQIIILGWIWLVYQVDHGVVGLLFLYLIFTFYLSWISWKYIRYQEETGNCRNYL